MPRGCDADGMATATRTCVLLRSAGTCIDENTNAPLASVSVSDRSTSLLAARSATRRPASARSATPAAVNERRAVPATRLSISGTSMLSVDPGAPVVRCTVKRLTDAVALATCVTPAPFVDKP